MDKLKIKADFTKYIEVFLQKNAKLNLISKNDEKLLFEKHIYDSLGIKLFFEKYKAIVVGNIKEDNITVDKPIGRNPKDRKKMAVVAGGRRAVTHFKVIERFGRYTYVEAELETGRSHQIRVHMASIGHPLLGDNVYGSEKQPYKLTGQVLHAALLGFNHPKTGEYMEFESQVPEYFTNLLNRFRNNQF